MMKKLLTCILLTLLLAQSTYTNPSDQDSDTKQIEYLEDNSYLTISTSDAMPKMSAGITAFSTTATKTKTKTKTKTINCYNKKHKLMWYVRVKGTFIYGNGSAKCTRSVVSAKSNNSLWVLSGKKTSRSGNKATASVTAKMYRTSLHLFAIKTIKKAVTLTCSSTGKFS